MHLIIAMLAAIATPAPRPTLPPVIYHVVPRGMKPERACGAYRFAQKVRIQGGAFLVKCRRPKGLMYARAGNGHADIA